MKLRLNFYEAATTNINKYNKPGLRLLICRHKTKETFANTYIYSSTDINKRHRNSFQLVVKSENMIVFSIVLLPSRDEIHHRILMMKDRWTESFACILYINLCVFLCVHCLIKCVCVDGNWVRVVVKRQKNIDIQLFRCLISNVLCGKSWSCAW